MRKKIVQIGKYYPPFIGGIENNTKQVADTLSQFFDVEVVCMRSGIGPKVTEVIDGITVHRLPSFGQFWRQEIVFGLAKVLNLINPDIIHFHAPNPLMALALSDYLNKNRVEKLIITHHADLERPCVVRCIGNYGYSALLKKSDNIIVYTSEFLKHSREISCYAYKAVIIPHGTICPDWVYDKAQLRLKSFDEGCYCSESKSIGFLGRIERWKNVDDIVRALKYLPNYDLKIAGDGVDRRRVEKICRITGVDERVSFLGWVKNDEKWNFLIDIDALILPSVKKGESFGQVLVEAQMVGTLTIVCDLPTGVREVVGFGELGHLVKPNSVRSIVNALKYLNDQEKCINTVVKAHENAFKKYCCNICEEKISDFFLNL